MRCIEPVVVLLFLPILHGFKYDGYYFSLQHAFLIVFTPFANKNRYEVYEVFAKNSHDYKALTELQRIEKFDFWTGIRKDGPIRIMTPPDQKKILLNYLDENMISHSLIVEDVQR